jgi:hypothetical protein
MPDRVAVLIFAHQKELDDFEKINFAQCCKVLNNHPIFLVCPDYLDTSQFKAIARNFEITRVPPQYLASLQAYNRFKISRYLYDRFAAFDFLLTYELDAFVFRDDLSSWCDKNYDFVGAPWFDGFVDANPNSNPLLGCNSGFSLRKTSSCQRVLRTLRMIEPFSTVFNRWKQNNYPSIRGLYRLIRLSVLSNLFHERFNAYNKNEDLFWSIAAAQRLGWFRVAEYEVARAFSFECLPERLYQEQNRQLPFGCHKWNAYNLAFWTPHIEAFGYKVPIYSKST